MIHFVCDFMITSCTACSHGDCVVWHHQVADLEKTVQELRDQLGTSPTL